MNSEDGWGGQNIPRVHKEYDGSTFSILPVLECLLNYNEDTIPDLLPSVESYRWDDSFANSYAWANNYYKVTYLEPNFNRYGCLPRWFPTTDRVGRPLTPQGQVDRFLYLLDIAYGGFLDDHTEVEPTCLADGLIKLAEDMGEYVSIEEDDHMEWELEANVSNNKIGILAYGSLLSDPGEEIHDLTRKVISDLETPFAVEYARVSATRFYAPTLVPVTDRQGFRVRCAIHVLAGGTRLETAKDILYRRETHSVGSLLNRYPERDNPGVNTVQIKVLENFGGIEQVLYTQISSNLPLILEEDRPTEQKAEFLAYLAINSINDKTYPLRLDGIYYLSAAIDSGVTTKLTELYRDAVFRLTNNSPSLAEARERVAKERGLIPAKKTT